MKEFPENDPQPLEEVRQAWIRELMRQARELEDGTVEGIPWPQAKASILAELEKRRAARS